MFAVRCVVAFFHSLFFVLPFTNSVFVFGCTRRRRRKSRRMRTMAQHMLSTHTKKYKRQKQNKQKMYVENFEYTHNNKLVVFWYFIVELSKYNQLLLFVVVISLYKIGISAISTLTLSMTASSVQRYCHCYLWKLPLEVFWQFVIVCVCVCNIGK